MAARRRSREVAPDHQTAIVVLTHDDKFDEPALKARSRPRRSTSARSARAATRSGAASGCSRPASPRRQLERIMGPCGLDIGADTQAETALSILGRDPRRARRARRRAAARGEAAHPRRGELKPSAWLQPGTRAARLGAAARVPDPARHLQRKHDPEPELAQRRRDAVDSCGACGGERAAPRSTSRNAAAHAPACQRDVTTTTSRAATRRMSSARSARSPPSSVPSGRRRARASPAHAPPSARLGRVPGSGPSR